MPVIGARVELVSTPVEKVVGTTFTDGKGAYQIPWNLPSASNVYVRVAAVSNHVEIHNNQNDVHDLRAVPFPVSNRDVQLDLLAKDSENRAGAFNILETIRLADEFLQKAEPAIKFPPIKVSWTPGNNPGTFFTHRDNQAFINGDRNVDSDEFDDGVIIHEYGHFVMAVFARDDSPGGSHGQGDVLDPRLAWSEGWANFFSCAVLNDSRYVDTGRRNGNEVALVTFDLDASAQGAKNDYWNEDAVGTTLWHIFDNRPPRPGDRHLGLGFKPLWEVVRGPFKARREATLIDFCDLLVARNPTLAKPVTDVLAARNIIYQPGKIPPVDNPFVRPLVFGKNSEGTVDSLSHPQYLEFDASAFYSFTLLAKAKVKLYMKITASKTPTAADLDLFLLDENDVVGWSNATNGVGGTETIEHELAPGTYYAEVRSWSTSNAGKLTRNTGSYQLTATFENP
jgi:hypothetical protein